MTTVLCFFLAVDLENKWTRCSIFSVLLIKFCLHLEISDKNIAFCELYKSPHVDDNDIFAASVHTR